MSTEIKIPVGSFLPDWKGFWTAKEAEDKLEGFKFKGPGWYIDKDGDTLLVYPDDEHEGTPWKASWPEDKLFAFLSYAVNPAAAFNAVANAPTRQDDRDLKVIDAVLSGVKIDAVLSGVKVVLPVELPAAKKLQPALYMGSTIMVETERGQRRKIASKPGGVPCVIAEQNTVQTRLQFDDPAGLVPPALRWVYNEFVHVRK